MRLVGASCAVAWQTNSLFDTSAFVPLPNISASPAIVARLSWHSKESAFPAPQKLCSGKSTCSANLAFPFRFYGLGSPEFSKSRFGLVGQSFFSQAFDQVTFLVLAKA
jgi:hypothetical protein